MLRRLTKIDEGSVLRAGFFGLLASVAALVVLDFWELATSEDARPEQALASAADLFRPPERTSGLREFAPLGGARAAPAMPGVVDLATDALEQPMSFTRGPQGRASAVGFINVGAAEAFAAFLDEQEGEVREVHFHSPGGSVSDALAMARRLRSDGIDAVAPAGAYCASSCPIALSGGVRRRVASDAMVGVHQVFADPDRDAAPLPTADDDGASALADGLARAQLVSSEIQAHLIEMGVRPSLWIRAMETPPESLYPLTREELLAYRLATEVVD